MSSNSRNGKFATIVSGVSPDRMSADLPTRPPAYRSRSRSREAYGFGIGSCWPRWLSVRCGTSSGFSAGRGRCSSWLSSSVSFTACATLFASVSTYFIGYRFYSKYIEKYLLKTDSS